MLWRLLRRIPGKISPSIRLRCSIRWSTKRKRRCQGRGAPRTSTITSASPKTIFVFTTKVRFDRSLDPFFAILFSARSNFLLEISRVPTIEGSRKDPGQWDSIVARYGRIVDGAVISIENGRAPFRVCQRPKQRNQLIGHGLFFDFLSIRRNS